MSHKNWILLLAASLAPVAITSCAPAATGDGTCDNGRCDDVPDDQVPATPCDGIMVDKSGAGHKKVAGRNNDALAKAIFHSGDSCPKTFQDMMAKLRETDTEGCTGDERAGIQTRLISETAQAAGTPTSYRAVTTRRCGGRGTEGIIFSLFGLRAGDTELPQGVEIISFDETAGVFNFYETDGQTLNFFGSSKDMLKGPGDGDDRRCASCHVGGGLVMKELDTPWINWEGHVNTPGAQELVDAHKDLGTKNTGLEFEGVVKGANTKWNKVRIAELTAGDAPDLQQLLRPLFCTVEINLDNGSDFDSPVGGGTGGDQLSRIPFDSLLDPQLKSFGSISINFADYDALIKQNGQTLQGVPGAIDTLMDYIFIERSAIDNDYVNQLKAAGIIDDDFIKDVLMVDFTRPVFSDDRCGLLTFAPELAAGDLNAQKVREGFIAKLEAETPADGSPGAVLLASLKNTGDAADHTAKVDAFTAACTALGSRPFLENALAVTSLNRNKARDLPVIEFEATLPIDNQSVDDGARLDPKTCQLTNQFVAP